MRVSLCGIRDQHDLNVVVKSGADAAGFLVGQLHPSTIFILPSTANRLARMLPPYITPVIITHLNKAEKIKEMLDKAAIYTVQIHDMELSELAKLRDSLPVFAKIILTRYSAQLGRYNDWEEIYPLIDGVVLDCYNHSPLRINDSKFAKKYEWRTGAEFINSCPKPVIISGGLHSKNVAQAIVETRPYGVETCRGIRNLDGSCCDRAECNAFVIQSKQDIPNLGC